MAALSSADKNLTSCNNEELDHTTKEGLNTSER